MSYCNLKRSHVHDEEMHRVIYHEPRVPELMNIESFQKWYSFYEVCRELFHSSSAKSRGLVHARNYVSLPKVLSPASDS